MRWIGRRASGNVEDRRGLTPGRMVGGGIGGIVIALIVMLLGGDPSALLNLDPGGGSQTGAPQERSAEENQLAKFVAVVLGDTEDVWREIFNRSGRTYREPTLVLFTQQVSSACGTAGAATGPFYCPGDDKLYIDLSFCDELKNRFQAPGDFAVAYVIAHEVGHHVQNLLGVMEQVAERRRGMSETEANELSVRLELQADFLAGVWAHHDQRMHNILEEGDIEEALNAASAVGDDRIQEMTQGRVVPDAFTHGSAEQRRSWFARGFRSGDLNDGDTFGTARP